MPFYFRRDDNKKCFSHSRLGFTLVELLVVIAIISILMGLLLPAVQMAREAARRTSCQNNLRQMALSIQNYHSAKGVLPAARVSNPSRFGHMVALLPYLEQGTVNDRFDKNAIGGFAAPQHQPIANTRLPLTLCPSDPNWAPVRMRTFSQTGVKYGDFLTSTGTTSDPSDPTILTAMSLDYWVNHLIHPTAYAMFSDTPSPKPIFYGSRPRMAEVVDGLSNTTMLLEHAGYDQHYVRGVGMPMSESDVTLDQPGAWGCWLGWCAFRFQTYDQYSPETYPTNIGTPAGSSCAVNCNNSQGIFGFHPTGANVAMGDGSVRYLNDDIFPGVVMSMVSRNGREVFGYDE